MSSFVDLPKPAPGSMQMRSRATPARMRARAWSDRKPMMWRMTGAESGRVNRRSCEVLTYACAWRDARFIMAASSSVMIGEAPPAAPSAASSASGAAGASPSASAPSCAGAAAKASANGSCCCVYPLESFGVPSRRVRERF